MHCTGLLGVEAFEEFNLPKSIILGQALIFSSWAVVIYGLIAGTAMVSFVKAYEEPTLASRYGTEYETYRRAVPGWLPRLTPWRG